MVNLGQFGNSENLKNFSGPPNLVRGRPQIPGYTPLAFRRVFTPPGPYRGLNNASSLDPRFPTKRTNP